MSITDSIRAQIPPVHPEGYPFIGGFAVVSLVLFWIWSPLGWIGTVLTIWCALFFRDPVRVTPVREGIVVAPADGRVSMVTQVLPPAELGLGDRPLPRVSIFMSVFNCHVNRSPMAERGGACYIWRAMPMPIDPKYPQMRRRRFRPIPVRMLVPNVITLLAICAGLTAIRLSTEGRMELAVAAIVFAAVLDGIDGRVARMITGQSKFGAELDSLADFVNFGVAPGLILYFWQLHELNNGGWIASMVFAISGGLRLARFNATMDDPNKPPFAANYFTGVPAPAGAG